MNSKERRRLQREAERQQDARDAAAFDPVQGDLGQTDTEQPIAGAGKAPFSTEKKTTNALERRKTKPSTEPSKNSSSYQKAGGGEDSSMNAKERRRLKRQASHIEKSGDENASTQAKKATNAKDRRLVKRKAERETTESTEDTKPKRRRGGKKNDADNGEKKRKSIHLTLFVGQLPYSATKEMLKEHFREAGDIEVRMLTHKDTGKFKGTAFIEVADGKALGAALSRHHTLMNGRRINVELTAQGGGTKSELRKGRIEVLRKKQEEKQHEKTAALVQNRVDSKESKLTKEYIDDRAVDFLSWFDYETAKRALDEFERCVGPHVQNRPAFFMGILKRFRVTDGDEDEYKLRKKFAKK